jgi:hypothetical protein
MPSIQFAEKPMKPTRRKNLSRSLAAVGISPRTAFQDTAAPSRPKVCQRSRDNPRPFLEKSAPQD